MNNEYITKQQAINLVKQWEVAIGKTGVSTLIRAIERMEAAEPVKHGRWVEQTDMNLDTYYDCLVCGESFCLIDGDPTDNLYNYCPNCGAKMDKEVQS